MSKRKSPFTVAIGADRPPLSVAQVLRSAQEANLLAAELLTEAQILIKLNGGRMVSTVHVADVELKVSSGGGQLSKSTTMRLRGLVELLAGEE